MTQQHPTALIADGRAAAAQLADTFAGRSLAGTGSGGAGAQRARSG